MDENWNFDKTTEKKEKNEFSNFGIQRACAKRDTEPQISLVGSLVILLNKARSEEKKNRI